MARITLTPPVAVRAMTAVAAALLFAAGLASAQPASAAPAAAQSAAAACQAADLSITIPAAIEGDPDRGMGKRAWNIVFRNTSQASCHLRGWPRIAVRTSAGKTIPTTVSDVTSSNLAVIQVASIVLPPGNSAVVTATSATAPAHCVTRWSLGLTLPGAARAVPVREPGGSFAPCVGGQLRLSPFYAEQTLTNDIKALSDPGTSSPFAAATAAEPATCAATALRAAVTSVTSEHDGSIIQLRLSNAGSACVLPEGWPTVELQMAGGSTQVAKIFSDSAVARAGRSLLTTYQHGSIQSTALTLQVGGSVSIALFAAGSGPPSCQQVTSLTVFPTATVSGTGRTAVLAQPVRICGAPRVLSFVPSNSGQVVALARGALNAAQQGAEVSQASSTGFYYGTDSSAPTACGNGSGPYTEPRGSCANGSAGPYGEYIGEVGTFTNWQGCTSGLAWNQANYNMATANVVKFSTGLGAAGYWFAAGPGRDPHYNGTAAEASAWGQQQAAAALKAMSGKVFDFRYVFFDIENNGVPPDEDGWNTVWNGPCGGTVRAGYIPEKIDFATWTGFASYIDGHSPYLAGVYSAGGDSYGSWTGIFGGEKLTNTAEWTFTNEQAQLDFPSGFTGSHASPLWFSSEPAACDLLWQWSGGDGVLNGYGDLDQAKAANDASPACAPAAPPAKPAPPTKPVVPVIIHHR